MQSPLETNYLINTIPECEHEFMQIIHQTPLFFGLSDELLHQIFQYSCFIKLDSREQVIEQGSYDQRIYILIEGKLNVLIENDQGHLLQVDVMEKPFTLFGERSLLGEPRGASLETESPTILLSLDLSFLPDILEGYENPKKRVEDELYLQNENLFTILALVLSRRLIHLEEEQYQLQQEFRWKQQNIENYEQQWISAKILDQFYNNTLPQSLLLKAELHSNFKHFPHADIQRIFSDPHLNTKWLYVTLLRLQAQGQIQSTEAIIFELIEKIKKIIGNHLEYNKLFQADNQLSVPIKTILTFLDALYRDLIHSNILVKPLSKNDFLEFIFHKDHLSPFNFGRELLKGEWLNDHFSMAYTMYLVCRNCIHTVTEADKQISNYLPLLSVYQPTHTTISNRNQQNNILMRKLVDMQRKQELAVSQLKQSLVERHA